MRKNTTSITTEPEEEEEAAESGPSEAEEEKDEEEEEEVVGETQQKEHGEVRPAAALEVHGPGRSVLNRCILLALIVAISMGFGHFYGKKLRLLSHC